MYEYVGRVCASKRFPAVRPCHRRSSPAVLYYILLLYYVIICGWSIKCICRRRPSIMLGTIMLFFYIESRSTGAQKQQIIHIVYLIILVRNIMIT